VLELADSHCSIVTDRYSESQTNCKHLEKRHLTFLPNTRGMDPTELQKPRYTYLRNRLSSWTRPLADRVSYAGHIGSHSYAENNQCYMYHCFWKDDRSCVNHPRHHVGVLDRLLSMLTCLQVELSRCAWRVSMAKVSTPCPNRGAST
jgi:hypothetical protein